jgi:phosphoglycolate phosphatase
MALLVVFDLDGTIVDTAPDLVHALNAVLAREQLPPLGYEQARTLIGGGARRMIESALKLAGRLVDQPELDRLFGGFVELYSAHIADRSRPYPGLEAALLDTLGLAARFVVICGQDTFGIQKPDPAMLVRTIAAAGGSLDRAVMVGDSGTDIATARGAGIPVIAVDFGYTDRPVTELDPDRVISHFSELPAAVRALMG